MDKCKVCGNETTIMHDNWTGYQEPKTYKIVQCNKCNVSYAIPTKVNSKIYDIIYKNKNKVPGYDRYYRYMRSIKKREKPLESLCKSEDNYYSVVKCIEKYSKEHKQNQLKILEIGSGLGYFTYALNMSKYEVLGVDISQNAVDEAIKQFGNFYEQYDILKCDSKHNNKYDIVIMTEVIEHIEEPKKFLSAVHSMLKHSGILIITTPNKNAYNKDKSAIWRTDLPPVHLWWFSEESINIMASELNFNEVTFFDVSKCSNAYYSYYRRKHVKERKLPKHILKENGDVISTGKTLLIKIVLKVNDIIEIRKFYMEKIKSMKKNEKPSTMCVVLKK